MSKEPWEPTDLCDVPLEQLRDVVAALAERLGLKLYSRGPFHGETEFQFHDNS